MNKAWKKILENASHYDHEDLENDYYARKTSGGILGFIVLGFLLTLALLLLLVKLIWFGI